MPTPWHPLSGTSISNKSQSQPAPGPIPSDNGPAYMAQQIDDLSGRLACRGRIPMELLSLLPAQLLVPQPALQHPATSLEGQLTERTRPMTEPLARLAAQQQPVLQQPALQPAPPHVAGTQQFRQQLTPAPLARSEPTNLFAPYRLPTHPTTTSETTRDWAHRKRLQANRIPIYDGKADLEGLYQWLRKVEHYGKIAVLDETALMEEAWAACPQWVRGCHGPWI